MNGSRTRARGALARWGGALLLAGVVLGAALRLSGESPTALDVWWSEALATRTPGPVLQLALFMDFVGGGLVATAVPIVAVALLLALRRWRPAGYVALAALASALLVQVLKNVLGRARPEDILVTVDFGSFPSGHVAHAATLGVVAWLLVPRAWVAVLAGCWAVVMAFARTYVSAHWLTDIAGGALLGAGVALLAAALLSPEPVVARRPGRGTGGSPPPVA
ncbi:phosphatase PAP2 family protein [Microbacterium marinilacus]|uniref:Phosphatidic acid phosphatase type 2/haloperoxidase domain-containing protein n=1 Tax=Microbacterium marinilacus TaxID=415209 RepID=A0ABP7BCR5_9MICO|nr:phosphatase PAP2 family protein [Microbacterium marinilacus]MBY0687065.1 phosphatase PAP2 family protein [Microbacterium marinilacus]